MNQCWVDSTCSSLRRVCFCSTDGSRQQRAASWIINQWSHSSRRGEIGQATSLRAKHPDGNMSWPLTPQTTRLVCCSSGSRRLRSFPRLTGEQTPDNFPSPVGICLQTPRRLKGTLKEESLRKGLRSFEQLDCRFLLKTRAHCAGTGETAADSRLPIYPGSLRVDTLWPCNDAKTSARTGNRGWRIVGGPSSKGD